MPRKAKLLTALLACVLVLTLIGVGIAAEANPTYIHPAIRSADVPKVTVKSGDLEFSRPVSDDYPFKGEYSKDGEWWYEYWAWHENEAKLTGKVEPIDTSANSYDCNKGILRITNTANESKKLSFDYDFSLTEGQGITGSLQIANEGAIATSITDQTFTTNLPAGGSIDIKMVFNDVDGWADYKNPPCATITITNIKTEAVSGQNLELCQPDNGAAGSYTAAKKDGTTLSIGQTVDINTEKGETVTLTAQPQKGYKFYLWVDNNGKPLSTDETFVVNGLNVNPGSVKPVFVDANATAYYQIPGDGHLSGKYYYWDDAMKAAGYSDSKNVVLLADLKLENAKNRIDTVSGKTFTIPSGVTLVVPYSDKLSTGKEDAVNTTHYVLDDKGNIKTDQKGNKITATDNPAPTSSYCTLTVTKGYTLNVNGTLLVNALQGSGNGGEFPYQSHIVGTYGKMVVGGTVTVNAGAKLYARGYVVDANHSSGTHNGQINVESGGSLIQMMQITDWRGGNYTLAVYQQLMPITMYYLQNNMVDTTYQYGSTMRAQAVIAYQNIFNLPDKPYEAEMAEVRIITNATDAADKTPYMFVMKNDAIIKTSYDYETDRLRFTLEKGTASMNALTISAGQLKIDTAKNVLAVSDNMPITVEKNATLETNYDLKFLPGAELTVNGTLNINEGSDLYFYGKGDYQSIWSNDQFRTHIQPVGEGDIVKTDKNTPSDDAKLNLNGTLTLSGTLSQSTTHSGLLATAGENAEIIITQPQKGSKSVNESLNRDYTPPTTSASDSITYVKTDDGYYYAVNKGWASLRGITVDGGESAVAFDQGTYKVHGGKWYSHKITVTYNMADNTGTAPTATEVYTAKNEYAFTAPSGYVITGITTGNTGVVTANADTADSTPISDGWKSVNLSNITAPEATLTATVKSYAHDVTWVRTTTEGEETKTTTTHSYLPSGTSEATLTFDGKVNIDASKVKIDDNDAGNRFTSRVENGKTVVTVTGIAKDTRIEVPYSSSNTVTWAVTTDGGKPVTTKVQTVAGSATYPLGNTESNDWKVVELDGGVSIQQSAGSKAVLKARTDKTADITVTDVLQDITVNITVTTYKHKVTTKTTVYDANKVNADKSETIEYFTNDSTYTPALTRIGRNDKYVVSAYTVTGGTLESKGKAEVCAVLPDAVAIDMSNVSTKETKVDLTLQSYLYVWNWDATLDGKKMATNSGFTYTEYLTDHPTGDSYPDTYGNKHPYYLTLRDYGEAGKYYHYNDENNWDFGFGIDYRSMGNNRFAISGTQDGLPDYTGGFGKVSLADGVLTEASWDGKITLKDEQVTVALVSYATKVTVKDGTKNGLPEGIFYAGADGKDVTSGEEIVYGAFNYNDEWDDYVKYLFVKGYTIGIDGAESTALVNNVGALLGDRFSEDARLNGLTISADTVKTAAGSGSGKDLTVTLTDLAKYHQVYAVSEDGTSNYRYLMFVQSADKDGPSQIYAPKAEKFNVSCTRQTDKNGNCLYYPTLTVKDGENSFFQSCTYRSATLDAGGKTLHIEGAGEGPDNYQSMKTVRFTLTPYTKSLTWNVGSASGTTYVTSDGKAYCGLNNDKIQMLEDTRYSNGTWTYSGYTVPEGKKLAPNAFQTNLCSASYDETTKNITVSNLNLNSTLTVVPSTAVTDADTYYMGDMSFEYVRNAAAFTWDGKTGGGGSWKPVNSFGWRHAVGSKSYEVDGKTLTVDNGSILFVNNTNSAVTYNVWLSRPGAETYGVSLDFDDSGEAVTVNNGAAAVTVQPGEQVTLVCRMTGTPIFDGSSEIAIGTIKVTKN